MTGKAGLKRAAVAYTFDRNGALVVNPYSLLTNVAVRDQISAAIKLGRVKGSARTSDSALAARKK